jgi:HSP20 family molecular chaperone IbpA
MNKLQQTQGDSEKPAVAERVNFQLPPVNIYEAEDGYTLEADLPGVTRESLEIFLDRNELTLVGRRTPVKSETVHYRESTTDDFRRVFELDPQIHTDSITAKVDNGVLTLHLAKREEVKPRRIEVNA